MQALGKKDNGDLVPHPRQKKEIGFKWIYKVKYNADTMVNHYKARLVAKGYANIHGFDYEETFA